MFYWLRIIHFHSVFRPHEKVPFFFFFFFFKFLVCGSLSIYTEGHPSKRLVGGLYFTFIFPHFVSFSSNLVDCIEMCCFLFLLGHRVFVHVYCYSVGHHCLFNLQSNPPYLSQYDNARFFWRHNGKFHLFLLSVFLWASWNHAVYFFVLQEQLLWMESILLISSGCVLVVLIILCTVARLALKSTRNQVQLELISHFCR